MSLSAGWKVRVALPPAAPVVQLTKCVTGLMVYGCLNLARGRAKTCSGVSQQLRTKGLVDFAALLWGVPNG